MCMCDSKIRNLPFPKATVLCISFKQSSVELVAFVAEADKQGTGDKPLSCSAEQGVTALSLTEELNLRNRTAGCDLPFCSQKALSLVLFPST